MNENAIPDVFIWIMYKTMKNSYLENSKMAERKKKKLKTLQFNPKKKSGACLFAITFD